MTESSLKFAITACSVALITASVSCNEIAAAPPLTNALKTTEQAEDKTSSEGYVKPEQRHIFNSTNEILQRYGGQARKKLKQIFEASNLSYPPKEMTWICLKQERALLLFAKDKDGKQKQILAYPIIGASGSTGPKLKEGDKQVPEGFYLVPSLHPNVIAHMALDVNYPSDEDRAHAKEEHRKNLGRDILIHGSRWSSGCLAMGNGTIEELYVLAYDSKVQNIRLIFAPCNLTDKQPNIAFEMQPKWLPDLYKRIGDQLKRFPIDLSKVPPPETPRETREKFK